MAPASVFVVEDEAIVAGDLRETLMGLGYSVAGTAKSGEAAVEQIEKLRPDLVLMDIHLAGSMDGIEAAGIVHSRFNTPVVYLTAYADTALLERARVTEPYGYLIKPYDDRMLQSTIEMALFKFKADEQVRDSEALVRGLVNLNREPVFILDQNTRILAINDALSRQRPLPDAAPEDVTLDYLATSGMISQQLLTAIQEHFTDTAPFRFEEEFGGRWIAHTITPLAGPGGRITRCAVQSFDITDIKKRELDLASLTQQLKGEKESLTLFAAMLDSMDDFVVATDMMGVVIYTNRAFGERFGYPAEEILKKPISLIKDPDDPFALDTNAFFVDKKRVWSGSVTLVTKFGIRIKALLKSTPVAVDRQNVCRVFVFRERMG